MGKKSERECCFRWPRFDKQTILYNMCQKQFLPKKFSMLCKIQAKCLELGGDVCSGITCDTWNCQGKRLNVVKFMKKMCTHSTHCKSPAFTAAHSFSNYNTVRSGDTFSKTKEQSSFLPSTECVETKEDIDVAKCTEKCTTLDSSNIAIAVIIYSVLDTCFVRTLG